MSEVKVEKLSNYALSQDSKPKSLFSKIGVVGSDKVAQNFIRLASSRGLDVVFVAQNTKKMNDSIEKMGSHLDAMINRWGMTAGEKKAIMSRIEGSCEYDALKGCDLVFEAIQEACNIKDKTQVIKTLAKIEKYISKDAIMVTDATVYSVTELTSELEFPERALSLHFLISQPDSDAVELAKGIATSEESMEKITKFITLIGKQSVTVAESTGGITSRLIAPLINDACQMYLEGVGSMDDIDGMLKQGLGLRHGPFSLADHIGLDKILLWLDALYNEFGDVKYKANSLIKNKVRAKMLGKQTGEGFFKYNEEGHKIEE